MKGGFVAIRRETLDHYLVGDERHFRPWCWLISTACWKPTKFNIKGQTVVLERGQLCASIRQMADAWGWSKSAVERFLTRLETETMIERKAGQGRSIISICNYGKYQDVSDDQRDSSGTQGGTAAGQQRDTKEQGNKLTSNKEPKGSKRAGARKKQLIALPDDWVPKGFGRTSHSHRIVSGWTHDEFEMHLEAFKAHHRKIGNKFECWQAAWSTWVLNTEKFKPKKGGNREGYGGSLAEIGNEVRSLFNG